MQRRSMVSRFHLRAIAVAGLALLMAPLAAGQASAAAVAERGVASSSASPLTGWTAVGSSVQNTLFAGEGVATVAAPGHTTTVLYRGLESIPSTQRTEGWSHIGDPDSIRGYVFDAYQGSSTGTSKMFLATTPSGKSFEYVHTLVPGELYNNSFAAVSPDTQWMIAGEWGTMSHLQIYPTPILNHRTAAHGGQLSLAGYIKLDHQVNDVQGCDFVTPRKVLCASDDDSKTLFPVEKPLVEVILSSALHGTSVKGHVVNLGPIPQVSTCTGTFEDEGIDFDKTTGILRLEVIQPGSCILKTTVDEYKQAHGHT